MDDLQVQAVALISKSEIPPTYKPLLLQLLEKFGYQWLCELEKCEERLGAGNTGYSVSVFDVISEQQSKELREVTDRLNDAIQLFIEKNGMPKDDPLEGFSIFVENIEFLDWEDEYQNELSFKQQILGEWREERIDFYRSVMKMKLPEARELSDKDMESIDIGRLPEACRTCGVIFYDNLDKHFGVRTLYCSIGCETRAKLQCNYCSSEYVVGKGVAKVRIMKLEGFCSLECLQFFKDDEDGDKKYKYSMKRMSEKFKVAYDPSITRREVFNRAHAVCAICKQITHLEKGENYDPLLATVDHIIPWTKGGEHVWDNLQLCCLRCNIIKGNRI